MKTYMEKQENVKRNWYHVDAAGARLGRLAEKVARILMGKNKPEYTPHTDGGDFVIVTNADKVAVTGKKEEQKQYHTHSAYLGGLKLFNYKSVKAKKPEYVITQAVKGMLPRNKLSYRMLKRLKVYRAESHPHTAQQAQTIKL